ncbi:MAG: ankyrin repeat domain-containing protein [Leptospirales bacterium]
MTLLKVYFIFPLFVLLVVATFFNVLLAKPRAGNFNNKKFCKAKINDLGQDAMELASSNGCINWANNLLSAGQDINQQFKYGDTPLTSAITNFEKEMVVFLIKNGADPNLHDNLSGMSPLNLAIGYNNIMKPIDNSTRRKIVKVLIEAGASVNLLNKESMPLFTVDMQSTKEKNDEWAPLTTAVAMGDYNISHLLIQKGAQVNITKGKKPIMVISTIEILELLIENGASVHTKDSTGMTPFHGAAIYGNEKIIIKLIELALDINARDKFGYTPLLRAIAWGASNNIQVLLDLGADYKIRTNTGKSALDIAKQHNNQIAIEILKSMNVSQ